jgi:hypothetical protein
MIGRMNCIIDFINYDSVIAYCRHSYKRIQGYLFFLFCFILWNILIYRVNPPLLTSVWAVIFLECVYDD